MQHTTRIHGNPNKIQQEQMEIQTEYNNKMKIHAKYNNNIENPCKYNKTTWKSMQNTTKQVKIQTEYNKQIESPF